MKIIRWLWRKVLGAGPEPEKHYYSGSYPRQAVSWSKQDAGPAARTYSFDMPSVLERDLMTANERELWKDIEGGPPKHEPIAYPPPAESDTQQWITDQLQERTGGITRHPFDKTQYPTAPNAADQAARDYVNERLGSMPSARAYFTHGYSMQRLTELKRMAERCDPSLTTEEIAALRVRGIA